MSWIRVSQMPNTSIRDLFRLRDYIKLDPYYQRQGNVWSLEKKQLLVDSIINNLDIPKLYFHEQAKKRNKWSVIDGRQRLEAIWEFMDGGFNLAESFELFDDEGVRIGGLDYRDFGRAHPELLRAFEAYKLTVMLVKTESESDEDIELVEEMFSRLNEAVPLNAPEKRNAMGGPLPPVARSLAQHPFFQECVWLENDRYRHLDFAAKFLLIEHRNKTTSTKKRDLDELFEDFKTRDDQKGAKQLEARVAANLDRMAKTFDHPDRLLASVGMIIVYYLLFRETRMPVSRGKLVEFDEMRHRNKAIERDIQRGLAARQDVRPQQKKLDLELVKFEGYAQSLNDPGALDFRVGLLRRYLTP